MTADDAQAAILAGAPFGAVFPLLAEADRDPLRAWFVECPDVPVGKQAHPAPPPPPAQAPKARPVDRRQAARDQGYTGDCCPKCQSTRMVMAGKCPCCQDCGEQAGCS